MERCHLKGQVLPDIEIEKRLMEKSILEFFLGDDRLPEASVARVGHKFIRDDAFLDFHVGSLTLITFARRDVH